MNNDEIQFLLTGSCATPDTPGSTPIERSTASRHEGLSEVVTGVQQQKIPWDSTIDDNRVSQVGGGVPTTIVGHEW